MNANALFKSQLPFRCQILGRQITFEKQINGQVPLIISDEASPIVFRTAFRSWEGRRGYVIDGPEERENMQRMEDRLMKKEIVRQFVSFYLAQPIGVRMFVFDTANEFYKYTARMAAIDEAILAWDALNHWQRKSSGKLKLSIACCAFRSRLAKHDLQPVVLSEQSVRWCLCSSNVSDPSGCCGTHKKSGTKTIFNYYPFFASEGFPDLAV